MKWKNSFVQRKIFFIYLTSTKSIEKNRSLNLSQFQGERERGGERRERENRARMEGRD